MTDRPLPFFADCAIDVDGPVPIYYQLQEWLSERIADGDLAPGSRLPSERDFAEQLGISRMTVRQAVDRLVRQGRLERRRGNGTFVTPPKVTGTLTDLRSASSELRAQGRHSAVTVLDVTTESPRTSIRRRLHLDPGADTAIRLRRLRMADGVPLSLETSWLPRHLTQPLLTADLATRSLNDVLQQDCGLTLDRATERLTVITLDEYEATHLHSQPGDPAFLLERTTTDDVGRPVEYVKSVLRGDLFAFETVRTGADVTASALAHPTPTTNG